MRTLYIINPISGKGKKQRIARILEAKGCKIAFTEYAGHAELLAREATEDVVVAVGGDGTVNEVARGIVGSDKTLGIIPCGSGDGLARHLGLSHNIKEALLAIEEGECKRMDAAEVNGRLFFSVCGVGFDAVVSERFAKSGKRGLVSYIRQGLKSWLNYAPEKYTIEIDGKELNTEALFITIGNSNQWGNNAKITPLADCCDGVLDITVVDKFNALELPWLAYRLMTGSVHKSRKVHCYKGKEIRITRQSEGAAHADGDWFIAPKVLNIKILPSALKVMISKR
ncbi:MAG: diacylglycerol kinase family lipid kinase [Alistipes sp.]|nr:diacylglycerol kinase family lipid kinase [Alistipes sp.]